LRRADRNHNRSILYDWRANRNSVSCWGRLQKHWMNEGADKRLPKFAIICEIFPAEEVVPSLLFSEGEKKLF
jgi:hypothetical protein